MKRTARFLSLVVLTALLAVWGAMPAFAAPASATPAAAVPTAVRTWMDTSALPFVAANATGDLTKATSIGTVRQVFQWSPLLWAGKTSSTPLAATTTWIAPLRGASGVLGFVTAAMPAGSDVVDGAFSNDTELGTALDRIRGAGEPVQDATVGEWFVVTGSTIAPLNAEAERELPKPMSLSDFQSVVAARINGDSDSNLLKSHALVIGAVALGMIVVLAVVGGFILVGRRRRGSAPDDEPHSAD